MLPATEGPQHAPSRGNTLRLAQDAAVQNHQGVCGHDEISSVPPRQRQSFHPSQVRSLAPRIVTRSSSLFPRGNSDPEGKTQDVEKLSSTRRTRGQQKLCHSFATRSQSGILSPVWNRPVDTALRARQCIRRAWESNHNTVDALCAKPPEPGARLINDRGSCIVGGAGLNCRDPLEIGDVCVDLLESAHRHR
jgi:hypothetical protein